MNNAIDDLSNHISDLNKKDINIEIYLIQKLSKTGDYILFSPNVSQELSGSIFDTLTNQVNNILKNKKLIEFDPLIYEDGTIDYLESDKVKAFEDIKAKIQANNCCNISDFKQHVNLDDISFYCFKITHNNTTPLFIFRKFSNPKSLREGFISQFTNKILDVVEEDFFIIDNKIDVIEFNGKLYILNRYYFEIIFSYKDIYFKILNDALSTLEKNNIIDNFENFKELCIASNQIAKKFTKIMKENSLSTFFNHKESISIVIEEYKLDIKYENGKLIYEDNISEILKLLSDDFVTTALGKIQCSVSGKTPLSKAN